MTTETPQQVLDYLSGQKTATLATASPDGAPHAATFMVVNDGLTLYFWARPSSTTAQHVERNPQVSFTVDEYVEDWNKAKGIQGRGECQRVTAGDDIARVVSLFADKFPSPTSGASTTNITFFSIKPTELQYIDNAGGDVRLSDEEFGTSFHREQVLSQDDSG